MLDFSFIAPTVLSLCPSLSLSLSLSVFLTVLTSGRPCEAPLFSRQACQLQSATPGCEALAMVWGLTGQACL